MAKRGRGGKTEGERTSGGAAFIEKGPSLQAGQRGEGFHAGEVAHAFNSFGVLEVRVFWQEKKRQPDVKRRYASLIHERSSCRQ